MAEDIKLNKVALLDVVPMKDETLITDVSNHKGEINRLMLHYANKTIISRSDLQRVILPMARC